MGNRWLWLVVAGVVAVALVAGLRGCASARTDTPRSNATAQPATPAAPSTAAPGTEEAAAREQLASARFEAMSSAVSTVHRYLTAAGGEDAAKADAFWAGGRWPSNAGDRKLRALKALTALRIENGTPTALDRAPVPAALEVPVMLRVNLEGEPQRRYRGWYRVRRAVAHEGWEISSASVDEVTGAQ